ncbi:unnamed protein product [Bathycoccus prasinos]
MTQKKKKVYVAFSSVHDDENDSSSNTNDAISTTKTSYSTKEKQLLRKLLLHEGQALTRSRAEEQQLKEQLEKRKKKVVLNASEVGSIRMPSELFGMRRVKVPGMISSSRIERFGEEEEDEEEEEEEEGEEKDEDAPKTQKRDGTTKEKKTKSRSASSSSSSSKTKTTKSTTTIRQRRKISYSASECSDFGQRFPIDSIVVEDPSNGGGGEQTIRISDLTVKTFLRDSVELLPQCVPLGLQFGDFRSAVSQSYDSNDEDKEACFRGDVCYRFLKTKRNEEKIIWHPISFQRKERAKEEKEAECNLESNDGWPFAFRASLSEDKKYIQLEMRLFWLKNELLKYGKEALERDGKHRFDIFAKNVESMLYYLERGYVGRGLSGEEDRDSDSEKKGGRTKDEEEEDSSNVVKELSVRMKRRLGRAPFATEISRELERL